jgi:hypothetical protein
MLFLQLISSVPVARMVLLPRLESLASKLRSVRTDLRRSVVSRR